MTSLLEPGLASDRYVSIETSTRTSLQPSMVLSGISPRGVEILQILNEVFDSLSVVPDEERA